VQRIDELAESVLEVVERAELKTGVHQQIGAALRCLRRCARRCPRNRFAVVFGAVVALLFSSQRRKRFRCRI